MSDKLRLTYVIADLHGRLDLLTAAIERIEAHAQQYAFGATVVFLGDYIDRGPQSRQVIERLMAGSATVDLRWILLRGNHEQMLLDVYVGREDPANWAATGGLATFASYSEPSGAFALSMIAEEHVEWISTLPLLHFDKHRVYVHAGVDNRQPLYNQHPNDLLWKRYRVGDESGHGNRHVVHGHDPNKDGPRVCAGRTDLDTLAFAKGRLVVGVFDDEQPGGMVDKIEIVIQQGPRS